MESQNKIKVVLLLSLFLYMGVYVYAQEYYRIVEKSGNIMSDGKAMKVGDLYRKGQKIDWPYGIAWLRVTRNGKNYKVTRDGIKRSQMNTSNNAQLTSIRYLSHRGWDTNVIDSTLHYSQQSFHLIGKKDFLYFERKSSENDVQIEAIWDYNGKQLSVPIDCTDDGKFYIITPKVFNNIKTINKIRLSIRETNKEGGLRNEYTHGLEIIYTK